VFLIDFDDVGACDLSIFLFFLFIFKEREEEEEEEEEKTEEESMSSDAVLTLPFSRFTFNGCCWQHTTWQQQQQQQQRDCDNTEHQQPEKKCM